MSQRFDLTALLREWPEDSGRMTVRFLRLDDGRVVLQRRVPLGIFQMESTGRPDGLRPGGYESVLADFRTREGGAAGRSTGGVGPPMTGSAAAGASRLPRDDEIDAAEFEAELYMHRALALAALGEVDAVVRDTDHVRGLCDAVNGQAVPARSESMARLRIQSTLLAVRAEVLRAMREQGAGRAVEAIDRGLAELELVLEQSGAIEGAKDVGVHSLRALRAAIVPKLPSSQREELRQRLEAAIMAENFELAAILRNELRQLGA